MSSDVTESARFYELLAWMELNRKRLITAALVIAVVALGISFYFWQKNQREIEANAALLNIGLPLQRADDTAGPSPTAYLKVAADFPTTRAGQRALLLAAGALFTENNYAEALAQFRKFLTEYRVSPLAPIALIGVAACLDAQNQVDEAVQAYQTVNNRYPNSPEAAQARLALGLLYEAKKQPELALKEYDEVKRLNAQSIWGSMATERREQLLIKYPNLARSSVTRTNLAGTNLAGTKLVNTNLVNTNLVHTNLAGTNLASSSLAGTNVARAGAPATHRPIPNPVNAIAQPKPTNAPTLGRTNE